MKKIIVTLDGANNVISDDGLMVGCITGPTTEHTGIAEIVLQLVKQGVSAEEIIKLKNADLL